MKIGIISDIHVDINQDYDVLKTLDRVAKEEHCELVLIAGDIHNNAYQSIESIAALNSFGNVSYRYVPGNHDLWNDHIDLKQPIRFILSFYRIQIVCVKNRWSLGTG